MMRYLGLSAIVVLFSCSSQTPADLVIRGGTIYTMDETSPIAEAVAVSGDKIVFAGSAIEVEKYIGKETQVIDLQGKTMTPGLVEGHGHIMGLGYNELNLDLADI